MLPANIQWKGLDLSFIPFLQVLCWFSGSSDPAGSLHFAPRTPPCVVTQPKYRLKNQTVELLWRSAAIIPQVPTLFYAWISAPESTNRWLLVLCAHEWHVRAVKWYLSVSRGTTAWGSAYQDGCLRLWIHQEIFWKRLDSFIPLLT